MKNRECGDKRLEFESPGRSVERGETELAFEGTAARGFHVHEAFGDVFLGIFVVRRANQRKRRLSSHDDLLGWTQPRKQSYAELRKREIAPPGDHVIGQCTDTLR